LRAVRLHAPFQFQARPPRRTITCTGRCGAQAGALAFGQVVEGLALAQLFRFQCRTFSGRCPVQLLLLTQLQCKCLGLLITLNGGTLHFTLRGVVLLGQRGAGQGKADRQGRCGDAQAQSNTGRLNILSFCASRSMPSRKLSRLSWRRVSRG